MSAEPKRVPLAQVGDLMAPGKPIAFRVLDQNGQLLLAAGQVIHNAHQLGLLLERGACVEYDDVETARKTRAAMAAAAAGGGSLTPSARRKSWFDHFDAQVLAFDTLVRRLDRQPDALAQLDGLVSEQQALIDRQPDAALFRAVRQDDKRFSMYAITHALHAATVTRIASRLLNWPDEQTLCALRVALTMNVSIVALQALLAEQVDRPTKRQLDQIRAHPEQSAQMLRDIGVTDACWLSGVLEHHEQPGGAGYPHGLVAVGDVARLVRAADVFTAKISPRAMRPAMPPQTAARQLFQDEQGGPIAAALIKSVGIYPPGDFVRLKNGEIAVVVRRATAGSAVQVASVMGANGKPLLGAPKRDTAQPDCAITGAVADRSGLPRVLPEQLYGLID